MPTAWTNRSKDSSGEGGFLAGLGFLVQGFLTGGSLWTNRNKPTDGFTKRTKATDTWTNRTKVSV